MRDLTVSKLSVGLAEGLLTFMDNRLVKLLIILIETGLANQEPLRTKLRRLVIAVGLLITTTLHTTIVIILRGSTMPDERNDTNSTDSQSDKKQGTSWAALARAIQRSSQNDDCRNLRASTSYAPNIPNHGRAAAYCAPSSQLPRQRAFNSRFSS